MPKHLWVNSWTPRILLMLCALLGSVHLLAQTKPPIPDFDIAYEEVDVYSDKCLSYTMANGSQLCIPEGAFVDDKGRAVQGQVSLRYREFHSAFDLLWAGIPMHINLQGKQRQLESDGMFEILAVQNGKALQLAPGKRIKVRLAGRQSSKDMQHFYLDTKQGWVALTSPVVEVAPPATEAAAEAPSSWDEDDYGEGDFFDGDVVDRGKWKEEAEFRAGVYRDMELDRMGYHNCDRLLPETTLNILASYRISDNNQLLQSTAVLVVYRGLNTIYTFYPGQELRLIRDQPCFLLAFMPNKRVLLRTAEQMASEDLNALHSKAHTFNLQAIQKPLDKPADLFALLGR